MSLYSVCFDLGFLEYRVELTFLANDDDVGKSWGGGRMGKTKIWRLRNGQILSQKHYFCIPRGTLINKRQGNEKYH